MPATPLPNSTRYFHRGASKVYFLPAVVGYDPDDPQAAAVTRAEIDAGTDLTKQVASLSGFTVSSAQLPTPDWASRFTSQIPGEITAEESSLTFWADKTGDDVRAVQPRDTEGFLLFCDGGDVTASLADLFPIRVSSVGKVRGGDTGNQLTVSYSITSEPAEDVSIPATV